MANSNVFIRTVSAPVAGSTTLNAEDHVMLDSGYLVPLADTASCKYAGQVASDVDNSGGSDGDVSANVFQPGHPEYRYHRFGCTGADETWLQSLAFAKTATTVALTGGVSNHVTVGRVIEVESATSVIVDTADRATIAAS